MASIEKGAYHIANNQIEYNPQLKNNFTLVVLGLENLARVGSNPDDLQEGDIITNPQEEIILSLKSCDTPKVTQEPVNISRGNSVIKFAGKPTFDDINMVVYDYMGSNAKDTLLAWQNLSYNTRYDYIGSKGVYKKNCVLYEYTPDGTEVRHWNIRGAWLKSVTPDGFDYEAGDAVTISATMSIDWAELSLPDGE